MQHTSTLAVPVSTCEGTRVVSHAGTELLAELADRIGLTTALSEATDSLRERRAGHHPVRVLVDGAQVGTTTTPSSPSPWSRRAAAARFCFFRCSGNR